ncbi:MAG: hypothetical protein IPM03_14985 [Sulfuritalea sp.]|nr:hypothetical protein [Sulfuritalea sp.]
MKILCVCHAGSGVGLGHLTRVLVAARAFKHELSAVVQLLIQGDIVTNYDLSEFPHRFIGPEQDLASSVQDIYLLDDLDVVVFDLHPRRIPVDFDDMLDGLRTSACRLVAIDGLLRFRQKLDLIFHPSFFFDPPPDLTDGAQIIHGWDCFLLNIRESPINWRTGPRVLALTGGSDVTSLGKTWPSRLDTALPPSTELHWVTGPFAGMPCLPQSPRIQIHHHLAPSGLGPLMQVSNYAVTVYGVSFFELLYLGIPTVVFSPYDGKDQCELEEIDKLETALVARNEIEATELLLVLMKDDFLAKRLSQRSRALLNKSGAHRFCNEVANLNKT